MNEDNEEDKIFIGCMTVQMGRWNPGNIVPGCVIKHCSTCNIEIHVAPTSQKLIAQRPDVALVCIPCMQKVAKETTEEVKWMGLVPGQAEEIEEQIRRMKEEKKP